MRKAFTILELLAATALTALLMVAVLQVIGSIGRTRAAMSRQSADGPWKADLLDALRRDLVNSSGIRYEANAVTLTGHAALDPLTLDPVHEPVVVTYGVTTRANRTWLYRRQAPRDGFRGSPAWSELLAPDVARFTLRPATDLPVATGPPTREGDAPPVPRAVLVELDGPAGRLIAKTLVVR
jgi:hypothetical protein